MPRLTGQMLADVVRRKGATAGSLGGWGWWELLWMLGFRLFLILRKSCLVLVGDQLHVMVADIIGSFDTVDRSILDCALGCLGVPF